VAVPPSNALNTRRAATTDVFARFIWLSFGLSGVPTASP
jgi:hypothetical protein